MVTVFFAIARCFIDSGFGGALIRKQDRTEKDLSTCFYFNVVVSVFFYIVLFLTAPLIAQFYNQPILTAIVRVSGLNLVIGACCSVQWAQFSYKVDFKSTAKISIVSTIVTGIVGVFLAYRGYGVWALVIQGVAGSLVSAILLWVRAGWRPTTGFSIDSFHYMFSYGSKLLASWLLGTLYENVYPLVIGKFYSPAQLGNFSRAQGWAALPSSNITGVIQKVTFPVLSLIQDDDTRLANDYRRLLRMSAFVVFPLMMTLAAVASPLVRVVITSKWDGCVSYLQIICFAMMWYPVHAINLNLLEVKGRTDLFFRLEVIKKIIGVCIMCVTIPLGIMAMCWGMIVESLLCLLVNTYYTGKLIHVGYITQLSDLFPILFLSLSSGFLGYFVSSLINLEFVKLLVGILTCCIAYLSGAYFFANNELKEAINIIRKKQ